MTRFEVRRRFLDELDADTGRDEVVQTFGPGKGDDAPDPSPGPERCRRGERNEVHRAGLWTTAERRSPTA
ncbi:hypothetical protein CCE02nite_26350 [Cellulosimicrobium cellulans]|uniref:Uncharacterized protein n=1 Tax=Cellulosimicrobium cellulans TaxID=1710 RepID=A0A4Y4DZX3_CELCE|nr:hypothetical protein CCE02nite_26350 [Cellulosimicrobium cellulans]